MSREIKLHFMKKIIFLFTIAVIAIFSSCGPSFKDKIEKAKQDSLSRIDSIEKINPYFKYLGNWSTMNGSKTIEVYATDSNYCYIVLAYNKNSKGELPDMSSNGPYTLKVSGKDGILISPSSHIVSYNKSSKCILFENENYFKYSNGVKLYDIEYIGIDGAFHPVNQNLIIIPGSLEPTTSIGKAK